MAGNKKVPLFAYVEGKRKVIGTAAVKAFGDELKVTAKITDHTFLLPIDSIGNVSFGWTPFSLSAEYKRRSDGDPT